MRGIRHLFVSAVLRAAASGSTIMPSLAVELIARSSGWVAGTLLQRNAFGVERRCRGFMRSHRWRTSGLQLDRGVQIECPGNLQLGENVTLFGGTHLVAGRSGQIAVGDHTHIGRNCVISGLGGITIGGGCSISSLVSIYSVSNHYHHDPQLPIVDNGVHYGPVQIGNDVWIGTGAAILPGVTIGDHAVVGAGAVVNRDVPPWMVVVGVPARILKDRRESQRPSSLLPASHDKATHRRSA